jgi:hypothetical protein
MKQHKNTTNISDEEITNIWLHMQGKSEGLQEAGKECNFPIMYTKAIIEYLKGKQNEPRTK